MSIAVIIPCYNEELTIKKVINDFKRVLPEAEIHVFDNNSTDKTLEIAYAEKVQVHLSPYQGKGNVIRHAFSVVDADYYIMIDADDTYDVNIVTDGLNKCYTKNLDMLNFIRCSTNQEAYRIGHAFGNKMLTGLINLFFKNSYRDILSGYRIFSKAFVKSFPAHSEGFEIETELSIYACQMRLLVGELEANYGARPEGSVSKLNTFKDGFLILKTIWSLVLTEKPLWFFGILSTMLGGIATIWFLNIYIEFLKIATVPRYPSLILNILLFVLSALSLCVGIILFYLNRGVKEQRRYMYIKYCKDNNI